MGEQNEKRPLYEMPDFDGQSDYLGDAGLDAIGRLVAKLPENGFDLGSMNATNHQVTASVRFPANAASDQLDFMEVVLQGATVLRTLHANLVAARAALSASSVEEATDVP